MNGIRYKKRRLRIASETDIREDLRNPAQASVGELIFDLFDSDPFTNNSTIEILKTFLRDAKIGVLSIRRMQKCLAREVAIAASQNQHIERIEVPFVAHTYPDVMTGTKPVHVYVYDFPKLTNYIKGAAFSDRLVDICLLCHDEQTTCDLLQALSDRGKTSLERLFIFLYRTCTSSERLLPSMANLLRSDASNSMRKLDLLSADLGRPESEDFLRALSQNETIQSLGLGIQGTSLPPRSLEQISKMKSLKGLTLHECQPCLLPLEGLKSSHVESLELMDGVQYRPQDLTNFLEKNIRLHCLSLSYRFQMTPDLFAEVCSVIKSTKLKALSIRTSYIQGLHHDHSFFSLISSTEHTNNDESKNCNNSLDELRLIEDCNADTMCAILTVPNPSLTKLELSDGLGDNLSHANTQQIIHALQNHSSLRYLKYTNSSSLEVAGSFLKELVRLPLERLKYQHLDVRDDDTLPQLIKDLHPIVGENNHLECAHLYFGGQCAEEYDLALHLDAVCLRNLLQHEIDYAVKHRHQLSIKHLPRTLQKIQRKCPASQKGADLDNACATFQLEFLYRVAMDQHCATLSLRPTSNRRSTKRRVVA